MTASTPDHSAPIRVLLAWSPGPRRVQQVQLALPPGSTVAQALSTAGQTTGGVQAISVWGRKVKPDHVLQDGDRVALCRPLRADPKAARRERFTRQGARTAGLFAKRRPGGKPGY